MQVYRNLQIKQDCQYGYCYCHPIICSGFLIELFYDIESGNKNPLLSLPENSKLKIAYQDPDKLDEYNNFGIGDRSNLITRVLAWQSDSADPFATLLDEIIAVLRQLSGGKHETH